MTDTTPFIRHIVLLMMENHSFDQMLGCFKSIYPSLEGVDPNQHRFNSDDKGNQIFQKETKEKQMSLDPNHDCIDALAQLENGNSGFIKDFISHYPKSSQSELESVMGYYPMDFLPALHPLAKEFVICDHWYSSVPGPTWPNRFFALSGTSSGRVKMPEGKDPRLFCEILYQNQETIFDRLDEAKKSWKVYYYDFPISLIFSNQWQLHKLCNYKIINHFFEDVRDPESDFPAFTFIEPKYLDIDQNDDHPPHNVMKAEKLIADVYNAIRSNEELWQSTLLVVVYDEHGGFYDHVSPPATIPPDSHSEEYTFDRFGVRVPALLISPWLGKRVENTIFDHTSLLKYLIDKWNLNPLGVRTANAHSIETAFRFKEPSRTDTIPFIRVSTTNLISPKLDLEKWDLSAHHRAIYSAANFLETKLNPMTTVYLSPTSHPWAQFKAKIGNLLMMLGSWLEQDAAHNRSNRINQTCKIVSQFLDTP